MGQNSKWSRSGTARYKGVEQFSSEGWSGAHFILESHIIEKIIFVKKGNQFYYKRINENPAVFEDLCSSHE